MQIATNNNTAKIISGILATISIAVIARIVVPAIWFWIAFEVSAALLVAVGCAGEWYLHHHPAGRKKVEKKEHHKLESRFIAAVVVGVFMEFFALGHAIPEAVRLEKDVASANDRASTNELQVAVLSNETVRLSINLESAKSNNIIFAARTLPRRITFDNENKFMALCAGVPKMPIKIFIGKSDNETEIFAEQVRKLLDDAGFVGPDAVIIRDPTLNIILPLGSGFITPILMIKNDTNAMAGIGQIPNLNTPEEQVVGLLGNAFDAIGFYPSWVSQNASQYLKAGEAAILIPDKNDVNKWTE